MTSSSSTRETRIGSRVLTTVTENGPWKGLVKVYRIGPCEVGIELNMNGSVPWIVGGPQPAIDYYYHIKLQRFTENGANNVLATIQAEHDGFPAHELFLEYNQKVVYHRSYVPLWFSSEPAGKTAYPGPVEAANGSRALAGQYKFQKWNERVSHAVP